MTSLHITQTEDHCVKLHFYAPKKIFKEKCHQWEHQALWENGYLESAPLVGQIGALADPPTQDNLEYTKRVPLPIPIPFHTQMTFVRFATYSSSRLHSCLITATFGNMPSLIPVVSRCWLYAKRANFVFTSPSFYLSKTRPCQLCTPFLFPHSMARTITGEFWCIRKQPWQLNAKLNWKPVVRLGSWVNSLKEY